MYVIPKSDAEDYVARRFPRKKAKRVNSGLAGQGSIRSFLFGLSLAFQREKSIGLSATYHFTFTGQEEVKATVAIRDKTLQVSEGHTGSPDLQIIADSQTWLRFLGKETNLLWALVAGRFGFRDRRAYFSRSPAVFLYSKRPESRPPRALALSAFSGASGGSALSSPCSAPQADRQSNSWISV